MGKSPSPTVVSMFTGAGGLDLGFEREGFETVEAVDIDPWCIDTLRKNRPGWNPIQADVREWEPSRRARRPDVLLAGFPCQGFSLGGNREAQDQRNTLYTEVSRVADVARPKVIVIENVLNLRTMRLPGTTDSFVEVIAQALEDRGYRTMWEIFKVSHYNVPQTRRRFVFVGFRDTIPTGFQFPSPGPVTTIRPWIYALGQGTDGFGLPNHDPEWGFQSSVHTATGEPFTPESEEVVPVRFSRTASDGHPIRSFDTPFPAVDTATLWGWAQGNPQARRVIKDRSREKFIRNPDANVTLWRVTAARLRAFTHRELARLQTFPDDWEFVGESKRDVQLQIGNAVPVNFATAIARSIRRVLP